MAHSQYCYLYQCSLTDAYVCLFASSLCVFLHFSSARVHLLEQHKQVYQFFVEDDSSTPVSLAIKRKRPNDIPPDAQIHESKKVDTCGHCNKKCKNVRVP